jgi:hypothetical protein
LEICFWRQRNETQSQIAHRVGRAAMTEACHAAKAAEVFVCSLRGGTSM